MIACTSACEVCVEAEGCGFRIGFFRGVCPIDRARIADTVDRFFETVYVSGELGVPGFTALTAVCSGYFFKSCASEIKFLMSPSVCWGNVYKKMFCLHYGFIEVKKCEEAV
jgi:hypothetical protein